MKRNRALAIFFFLFFIPDIILERYPVNVFALLIGLIGALLFVLPEKVKMTVTSFYTIELVYAAIIGFYEFISSGDIYFGVLASSIYALFIVMLLKTRFVPEWIEVLVQEKVEWGRF
jgi:hypothetical protein